MREKDKWGFRGEAGQSGGAVSISCKSDHLAEGPGRHRARHSAGRAGAGLRSAGPASVFPLPPALRAGSRLSCQCGQPLVWSLLAKAARPRACSHTYAHARTHTHTHTHTRAHTHTGARTPPPPPPHTHRHARTHTRARAKIFKNLFQAKHSWGVSSKIVLLV